ncbi:MAG: glycosyltransferase [Bacteroidales bacterium]|jgi:glycosyltransferase involved in cell wall biosynthesis|nr:glycosyltransferase [Bacteroidales bacterium]
MTFIFWHPILCHLHSAYLRNLAEKHQVILVSEIELSDLRIQHGFQVPDYGKVQVVVAPSESQMNELFQIKDAVHIVAGVWAYKIPSRAFKIAVKRRLNVGIYSEPFNWMGIKGKLRLIKYWLFRALYSKHIRFILTTGNRGRWCFESVGFDKSIIYDWAYFTETPELKQQVHTATRLPKLLFIGSIDARKNILSLIEICKKLGIIDQLHIVGVGTLEPELRHAIENTNCQYLGKVLNCEVHSIIAASDVLILPSIYDGWGAVVNEALMCGTPVIASDNCGSSVLLQNIRGRVFSIKNDNLEDVLRDFLTALPYDISKREEIKSWAIQNISGETAAKYFNEIMENVMGKTSQKPVAPWLS